MLPPVFMAVARTADTFGMIEDCQTAVKLYGSPEDYCGGQKSEFYLK